MSERKMRKALSRVFSVLLAVVMILTANERWSLLRVSATEGEQLEMTFSFDDRGDSTSDYVCLEGEGITDSLGIKPWQPVSVVAGKTYRVALNPPEERKDFTPIVEVRFHAEVEGEPDIIYSSEPFWDEREQEDAEPNLVIQDGKFEIAVPAENCIGGDVNIWWCDYDRAGGWYDEYSGEGEYCIEVVRNGEGEAYVEGISEYPVIWEYEEYDDHNEPIRNWGGQKIILSRELFKEEGSGVTLKFQPYGDCVFGRLQANYEVEGREPYVLDASELEEGQEPSIFISKEDFNQWCYLNLEVNFDGGTPSFNVIYDDYMGSVDISGKDYPEPSAVRSGAIEQFSFGETYTFTLNRPENRTKDCEPIVEVRVFSPEGPPTTYSNVRFFDEKAGEDAEPNLTILDNQFSLSVPAENEFCGVDVNIWWSEFDRINGWRDMERNEGEYCLQVRNDGNGEAYFEGNPYPTIWEYTEKDAETGDERGYGCQKFLIPINDVEEGKAILKFFPYGEGTFRELEIELSGRDPVRLEAKDFEEGKEPEYQLKAEDFDDRYNLAANVNFFSNPNPGNERVIFYRVEGDGEVSFDPDFVTEDNNGWKVGSIEAEEITVTITPGEGVSLTNLSIDGSERASEVVDNRYTWKLRDGENYITIRFGEKGDEPQGRLANYIKEQNYLFGDWNNDGSVDEADLKLGIAQQIYYPQFSDPNSRLRLKTEYPEISKFEDLMDYITIGGRDENFDITAWSGLTEGTGTKYTIPAYKYSFKFSDSEKPERNADVEGIAWLFDFNDDSNYANNSVTDVLMELTDENGEKAYFIRDCSRDSADCIDPVTKNQSGEGAYCAVGDYKVAYNEEERKYDRSVAIWGNGAALDDFLMTDDDEILFATIQGRNDMFAMDTGHNQSVIFGKFSFYKNSFVGMKIQGSGAAGNTPAWSFATDPIWGSDTDINTEKEAIIYFGNETVIFKPVTLSGDVTAIEDLKVSDSSIPEGAIRVWQDNDVWKAKFESNYYDNVKFEVTYQTNGNTKTQYILIHRVGIDIEFTSGGRQGEAKQLFHGTENGPLYTVTKDCERILKATYYYPEDGGTDSLVDLFATYTWPDGTVTKKVIKNDSNLNLTFHHDDTSDVQSSDFVLYEGSTEAAPVKVEVSAVVAGFEDENSFTGMRLGAGKGVCWSSTVSNQ